MGYNPAALETHNLPQDRHASFDTGQKDRSGKPILAPVWTAYMRYDEDAQKEVPVVDEGGEPVFFHRPDVRRKILMLCRLLPLAVNNCHLVEVGPRNSGKSYLLRSLSPHVFVVPAGRITAAQLLYSNAIGRSKPGLLATHKVVVLDDMAPSAPVERGLGQTLKDYLAGGVISRGTNTTTSEASFFVSANIDPAPNGRGPMLPEQSWLRVLPAEFNDAAIADRLAGIIPGWELPKITDGGLAKGVGFLADWPRASRGPA